MGLRVYSRLVSIKQDIKRDRARRPPVEPRPFGRAQRALRHVTGAGVPPLERIDAAGDAQSGRFTNAGSLLL